MQVFRDRHAEINSALKFDEDTHIYTYNGKPLVSSTTFIKKFFEKFDADYWAAIKAPKLGMSVQEVKDMWAKKGQEAADKGTKIHIGHIATSRPGGRDTDGSFLQCFQVLKQID